MNIIKQVIALFKVKSVVEDTIKEAQTMNGITPGWKTSEFWSHLAVQIGTFWAAIHGFIPAKYEAIIAIAGTAVYTISRTAYKAYVDGKSALSPVVAPTTNTTVTVNP